MTCSHNSGEDCPPKLGKGESPCKLPEDVFGDPPPLRLDSTANRFLDFTPRQNGCKMKSEFGVLMCIMLLTAAAQPSHAEVHQSRPIGEDSEELRSALQNKFGTEYQVFGRPEWQSSSTYLFVIKGEGRDSVLLIDRVKGNLFGLLDVVPQDSKNAKPYIVEEILWLSQNQVVASIDFLEPSMFGYVRRPNLVLLTVKWDEHRY